MTNIAMLYLLNKTATLSIVKDFVDSKTGTRTITLQDAEEWGGYVRLIFDHNGNFIKYDEKGEEE